MFLISVAHLGLVMEQVSVDVIPLANVRAQILLATFQVRFGRCQRHSTFFLINHASSSSSEIWF
jgi:hypothetical protein